MELERGILEFVPYILHVLYIYTYAATWACSYHVARFFSFGFPFAPTTQLWKDGLGFRNLEHPPLLRMASDPNSPAELRLFLLLSGLRLHHDAQILALIFPAYLYLILKGDDRLLDLCCRGWYDK